MNNRRLFYMNITNKCNNNCLYCISYSTQQNINEENNALATIIKADREYKFTQSDIFIVNGGEPTLSDEFDKLLDFLISKNINIRIYTNGRNLYKQKIYKYLNCKKLNFIIPFYGLEKTHDYFTQSKNSFNETFLSIKKLQKNNVNFSIKFLIEEKNQIEEFYQLLNILNLRKKHIHISLLLHDNFEKRLELAKNLNAFIHFLFQNDYKIALSNFPLCALDKEIQNIFDNYDEISELCIKEYYFLRENNIYKIDYDKNHNWMEKCKNCKFINLCADNSLKYLAIKIEKTKVYLGEK